MNNRPCFNSNISSPHQQKYPSRFNALPHDSFHSFCFVVFHISIPRTMLYASHLLFSSLIHQFSLLPPKEWTFGLLPPVVMKNAQPRTNNEDSYSVISLQHLIFHAMPFIILLQCSSFRFLSSPLYPVHIVYRPSLPFFYIN